MPLAPAGEPTSLLLRLKKKQVPHQGATPVEAFKGNQDAGGNYEQEQWIEDTAVRLSEGRGQNNQQPTPNDNNKRVVVFLCGSGI